MSQIKLQRRQSANKMPNDNSNSAEKHSTLSGCFNRRLLTALPFFVLPCAGLIAFAAPSVAAPTRPRTIITTYAGGPGHGRAKLFGQAPGSVAIRGNLVYLADNSNYVVRVLDATTGRERVVAGNLAPGFSGDGGPATSALLNSAAGIALDSVGNLYIADPGALNSPMGNSRIRKVDNAGIITTVAGTGRAGYSGDGGPATSARLNFPSDVAVDSIGNLYIADTSNGVVRKVDPSGIISTVATGFSLPVGVMTDSIGNVYISDAFKAEVLKLDPSGVVTVVAGNGSFGYSGDGGPATSAQLFFPNDTGLDSAGNLYIADSGNNVIRKVDTAGIITTVAGDGTAGFSGDGGRATAAELNFPSAVEADSSGNLYICDLANNRARAVNPSGIINTVAGNGRFEAGPDGRPPTQVEIGLVEGVATTRDGSVYVADVVNSTIRKVSPDGVVTTVAGTFTSGYSGDGGPATSAQLNGARDVALDAVGNLYIADTDNSRVRKVDSAGIITTVAGTGVSGFSGDGGPATAAQINSPRGVEIAPSGNLYIADSGNACVREVNSAGVITTVAGTGGVAGNSGDGGPATSALLSYPEGVAFDGVGNYYIADDGNANVRKVDASGVITTFAGTGIPGFSGDGGPATAAKLLDAGSVVVDSVGNVFIADIYNNRVRKVNRAGIITTFAGSGAVGNSQGSFGGDGGKADSALLNAPIGLAVDMDDNLYIGDFVNQRIRRVQGPQRR